MSEDISEHVQPAHAQAYLCVSVRSLIALFVPKCFPAVVQPLRGQQNK